MFRFGRYMIYTKNIHSIYQKYPINKIHTHIHPEYQYLNLIKSIIQNGDKREGRNGSTLSIFGRQMRFCLKNGQIPFITTKKLAWKTCFKELMWFIKGQTNNAILRNQNVKIWNQNASREFLDLQGLRNYPNEELGPIYGFQWRNFNGTYQEFKNQKGENAIYKCSDGVDQLKNIIDILKNEENRFSRRIILTAWNPIQLSKMALPPCHILAQFYVNSKNELSCQLYQRSGDVGLGIPFNIASYSFLVHILAKHCELLPGEFIHTIGDCHIYEQHIEPLKEQINRQPLPFPNIIVRKRQNIEDYNLQDIEIQNYQYHNKVEMNMIA